MKSIVALSAVAIAAVSSGLAVNGAELRGTLDATNTVEEVIVDPLDYLADLDVDERLTKKFNKGGSRRSLLAQLAALSGGERRILKKKGSNKQTKPPTASTTTLDNDGCKDGNLDTLYGDDGKVSTAAAGRGSSGIGYAIAVAPAGDFVIAGPVRSTIRNAFGAIKYKADGSVDKSFGNDGIAITQIGDMDVPYGAGIQKDGKIVLAGRSSFGAIDIISLLRYTTDGKLDKSFGKNGIVSTQVSSGQDVDDRAHALIIQDDGKIVIGGQTYQGKDYDFLIARYLPNGDLDSSFGNGNGYTITSFGPDDDRAFALTLQADGKFVLAGEASTGNDKSDGAINDMAVARYTSDGKLDGSFGDKGKAIIPLTKSDHSNAYALGVAVQTDGKILLTGYAKEATTPVDFALVRLTEKGNLDASFASKGKALTDLNGDDSSNDFAKAVAVQDDGTIIVVGYAYVGKKYGFVAARYRNDGSIDESFGENGVFKGHVSDSTTDLVFALGLQPHRALLAGYSNKVEDFVGQTNVASMRLCA